jgi:Methyltransferase domain
VGGDPEALIQNKIAKAGGPFSWAISQLREHAPLALERCKLLRVTSTQAARIFDIGSVHMAFIDGDHRFEAVREDCLAWWPRIASGGFLAGHDWPRYQSVRDAVTDFACQQFPPLDVKFAGSSWIVRK